MSTVLLGSSILAAASIKHLQIRLIGSGLCRTLNATFLSGVHFQGSGAIFALPHGMYHLIIYDVTISCSNLFMALLAQLRSYIQFKWYANRYAKSLIY